jgi:hypothetical protein
MRSHSMRWRQSQAIRRGGGESEAIRCGRRASRGAVGPARSGGRAFFPLLLENAAKCRGSLFDLPPLDGGARRFLREGASFFSPPCRRRIFARRERTPQAHCPAYALPIAHAFGGQGERTNGGRFPSVGTCACRAGARETNRRSPTRHNSRRSRRRGRPTPRRGRRRRPRRPPARRPRSQPRSMTGRPTTNAPRTQPPARRRSRIARGSGNAASPAAAGGAPGE